jgi:polyferredoxin
MSSAVRPSRESVTTIQRDGSRFYLHPADVRGRFTLWRRLFAVLLLAVYVALPWIPINGHPAVFLDVMGKRFHLFGLTFAAQDLGGLLRDHGPGLLALLHLGAVRATLVWLGLPADGPSWSRSTGASNAGSRAMPRRGAALTSGTGTPQGCEANRQARGFHPRVARHHSHLLAYFVSIPQLWGWILEGPLEHWNVFLFVAAATGVIYFNFSWFREQLCLVICPYGRLQSALVDDDTLVIGYDAARGEPRGKARAEGVGDCIDCNRCVAVCPTGIDIRQGLQIECIGCANCVDACDAVMAALGRPRGLVRYDSLNGLSGRRTRFLRPRVFLYSALILLGAGVMTFSATKLGSVTSTCCA